VDERWSPDVVEVAGALRAILTNLCTEAAVRRAEANEDGRDRQLEGQLARFGVHELTPEPELLAAVAMELGRALAPVPFVELTSVRATIGQPDTAWVPARMAPVGAARAALPSDGGIVIVDVKGPRHRTSAGDVVVELTDLRGRPVGSPQDADRAARLARLLGAARIVGASQRMLAIGTEYAKERHAFGRPIGSYQAVAHKLVDAAIAVDGADLLVRKASWVASVATGGDGAPDPVFARMAWAKAVEAGRLTARNVHQAMGGFGATLEYPAQLCSRRIRSWALRLSRPVEDLAEVARRLLDPATRQSITYLWNHDRGIPIPRWARELDVLPAR
jgi:hypothetical protein